MAKKPVSMQEKVISALKSGKTLSVEQIKKIGMAKPYNAISVARARGMDVVTSTKKTKNKTVTSYSISKVE